MNICHVGALPSPNTINGVNSAVWMLAAAQARLGLSVSLLQWNAHDADGQRVAQASGIELIHAPTTVLGYDPKAIDELVASRPSVVHMHSVFVPQQATLARRLKKEGIPYLITPHGGLAPPRLARNPIRKLVFSYLVEKSRFRNAAALCMVTPGEEAWVRNFVGTYSGILRWMPNPIDTVNLAGHDWSRDASNKRLLFLGRFDVETKGIDILVDVMRRLPGYEAHLYGSDDPKTLNQLNQIRQNLPANVFFHEPIFGAEKAKVIAGAALYVQMSRSEGFPLSVAEAMYVGTPCAISAGTDPANLFRSQGLGLVVPKGLDETAAILERALTDGGQLHAWSTAAREFAHRHFDPMGAAQGHADLYAEVAGIRETSMV